MYMATETSVLTVRIPVELQQRLDAMAQAIDRSRSWVVTRALEEFVDLHSWQVEEIHRALQAADAGDFATPEEMDALNTKYQQS
jgi:RHH-type rel operon transcriptional repressor/antitoxin RelB